MNGDDFVELTIVIVPRRNFAVFPSGDERASLGMPRQRRDGMGALQRRTVDVFALRKREICITGHSCEVLRSHFVQIEIHCAFDVAARSFVSRRDGENRLVAVPCDIDRRSGAGWRFDLVIEVDGHSEVAAASAARDAFVTRLGKLSWRRDADVRDELSRKPLGVGRKIARVYSLVVSRTIRTVAGNE